MLLWNIYIYIHTYLWLSSNLCSCGIQSCLRCNSLMIVMTASRNILCMRPTNERQCYIVTSSLIGWVHTQDDPCCIDGPLWIWWALERFDRGPNGSLESGEFLVKFVWDPVTLPNPLAGNPRLLNDIIMMIFMTWLVSACPSVRPSVDRIVSALYLPHDNWQYWPDTFHIYTPYQATLESVSRVKIYSKFEILANSLNLYLWLCLDLTWDPIWINSMLIMGQRGVSSDRRPSSCSSFN